MRKSNDIGKIEVRFQHGRGWHQADLADREGKFKSRIVLNHRSTAIHEFGHRLQAVMPELDQYFRDIHTRRTKGEPLMSLRDLAPRVGYGASEKAREDKYVNPYFGKEYGDGIRRKCSP